MNGSSFRGRRVYTEVRKRELGPGDDLLIANVGIGDSGVEHWNSRGRINTLSQLAAFREPRVEAPNCGLGEFQSCRADASCAPAARARPSAD